MGRNPSVLDHLKDYISLTQKAKFELENGNKKLYGKYFDEADAHLKEIGWEELIVNNK